MFEFLDVPRIIFVSLGSLQHVEDVVGIIVYSSLPTGKLFIDSKYQNKSDKRNEKGKCVHIHIV